MVQSDVLSRLLLLLYEGATNPQSLQQFLDELAISVGAMGGAFREQFFDETGSVQLNKASLFLTTGYSQESLRRYADYYHARDILVQRALEKENRSSECATSDCVMPESVFRRTELYTDYYSEFDLGPTMWVKLADQPRYVAAVSLQRPGRQSNFGDDELKLLIALKPHMQQLLRLSQTLRGSAAENALLTAKLEEMDAAICMIHANGSVARLTPAAETILKNRSGIWIRSGRLETSSSTEQRTLNALIAAACATAQGRGTEHPVGAHATSIGANLLKTWTAPAGGAMLITRNAPMRPLQLVVSPFCSAGMLNEPHPAALIQFSDPSSVPGSRSSVLRALYALTPTESRLADLLVEGLDLRQASDRMRITFETARFNLKRVMAKTGTRRQGELIRLILSLPGSSPGSPDSNLSSR